ncbi:hypothetical protein K3495_g15139 [Podosphaera aphanis]|nr:hypothetical protein K3495_g15139 [Podosphaera aphanis]
MPPQTSHILQPLDLSCFSPLKARYRQLIEGLSTIHDSAPVKKQRFINCYHEARNKRLEKLQIQAGWRAAGLFPFNHQKGLKNPFTQPSPQPRLKTPEPPSRKRKIDDIHTPREPAEVYAIFQIYRESNEGVRSENLLTRKIAKSIGELQAQLAEKMTIIEAQALEIERLSQSKRRKRITVDANTQFSNIEVIKRAQEEAELISDKEVEERAQRKKGVSKVVEKVADQTNTYLI